MVWYSHILKNFPQFIVIHMVKGFGIVSKAEIDVFLEPSCFSDEPRSGGCTGAGGPRGATPRSRSGGAAGRERYPSFKVKSSGCALLEQP